jgi:hypothetical protein
VSIRSIRLLQRNRLRAIALLLAQSMQRAALCLPHGGRTDAQISGHMVRRLPQRGRIQSACQVREVHTGSFSSGQIADRALTRMHEKSKSRELTSAIEDLMPSLAAAK